MFKKDIGEFMESKVCSPLAIAVCSGDLKLVELILAHMNNIELEFGLQVKTGPKMRLKTPL